MAAELIVDKVIDSFIHQLAFLNPWAQRRLSLQSKHKASWPQGDCRDET